MEPLYQNSFFSVNRQLSKLKQLANEHPKVMDVSFVGYNTWNRCINFFDILTDRERLKSEKAQVMIEFLCDIGHRSPRFLEKLLDDFCDVFPGYLFRESITFIQDLKHKSPAEVDLEAFVYHLLILYHHFPRHPELMFDGCIFRVLPRINGTYPKWTHAKLDPVYDPKANLDYTYYPWSKLELYDGWNKVGTHLLDQENSRGLKIYPDEPVRPTNFVDLYFERSKLMFCYLDPFLLNFANSDGTEFDGRSFYSFSKNIETEDKEAFRFLVLPLYDEGLPDRPYGQVLGNIYYLFKNQDDRDDFLQKDFGLSKVNSSLMIGEVKRSRNERLLNTSIMQPDPLHDLIQKLLIVQDWEKVLVFKVDKHQAEFDFLAYRHSAINQKHYTIEELAEPENYEDRPHITGRPLSAPLPETIKVLKDELLEGIISCRDHSAVVLEDEESRKTSCFFLVSMHSLLSQKILPNLSAENAGLYRDRVLCFQFPETTLMPTPEGDKATLGEGILVLGNRYLDRILPIFNQLLLKQKVLSHSVTSAVAAIISRNHSHHIGSHVTPRTSIEKCRSRLKTLEEGKYKRIEVEDDIIAALKLKLDEYIQQKADFTAEIATEPIISTKKSGFFNQVMAKFIQNTLLMDNLGANEGVNYAPAAGKKSQSRNRLKIHFYKDGKETRAIFGDPKLKFGEIAQSAYPYPGISINGRQLILKEPAEDYDVALPGPMGEFAFYSFLENFIRNAIKHNIDNLTANGNEVNIHINLCQIPEEEAGHLHFLKCEIWDDLTPSDAGLIKDLRATKDKSLVDREGKLVKGGWGVAEMKIMATLLSGSTNFLDMSGNFEIKADKKEGKAVLVYEFDLMKPKDAAVISSVAPEHKSNHEKQGIFWFDSIGAYNNSTVFAPTHFDFILIDNVPGISAADIEKNLHLFPGRVLIHETYGSRVPGTAVLHQDGMELIRSCMQSDQIHQFIWQCWLNRLQTRHAYENPRISIFFEQKEDETPTRRWKRKLSGFEKENPNIAASVIYKKGKKNFLFPESESGRKKETHFIFDRHGGGYHPLKEQYIVFHELFDKNSADFVPIFTTPKDQFFSHVNHLAEAAFTRILILDERVAELAFDSAVPPGNEQKRTKEKDIYGSTLRIDVAKYTGIYIATHLNLNGGGPRPITPKIDEKEGKGYCVSVDISQNGNKLEAFNINRLEAPGKSVGKFDVAIIHQGVLETFLKPHINQGKKSPFIENTADFIASLKQYIPGVVIDSGRGIPANLPENIKFLPFSLMEGFLMKDRIAKLSLTKVLMSLTRRSGQ